MSEIFLQNKNLEKISNVVSIVCQEDGKFDWTKGYGYQVFTQNLSVEQQPTNVYFILDTHNQNAFAHWVFENFVYLQLFFQVKKSYPEAKIVLYERKDYKYLFLENNGVAREDIVEAKDVDFQYLTLNNQPVEQRNCSPNLVFFHPYASLNNQTIEDFHLQAILSYDQFIQNLPKEKTIPILYLPRGEKENFAGLDRRYIIQKDCKELVTQLGGGILETDTNTDLFKQIRLVRSAKIILCDYGSNLWVNGFFSENAHILFLNIGWRQEHNIPYYGFLYSLIHEKNKNMYNILAERSDESVKPTLVYHSFPYVKNTIETILRTA